MPDCPTPTKKAYTSLAAAELKLSRIWGALLRPRYPRHESTPCRSYRCEPGCGLWHLTKNPHRQETTTP